MGTKIISLMFPAPGSDLEREKGIARDLGGLREAGAWVSSRRTPSSGVRRYSTHAPCVAQRRELSLPLQEAGIPAPVECAASPGTTAQGNVNTDSKTWSFFVVLFLMCHYCKKKKPKKKSTQIKHP